MQESLSFSQVESEEATGARHVVGADIFDAWSTNSKTVDPK